MFSKALGRVEVVGLGTCLTMGRERLRLGAWPARLVQGRPTPKAPRQGSLVFILGWPIPKQSSSSQIRSQEWALPSSPGRERQGKNLIFQGWNNRLAVSSAALSPCLKQIPNFRLSQAVSVFLGPLSFLVFLELPFESPDSGVFDIPTPSSASLLPPLV